MVVLKIMNEEVNQLSCMYQQGLNINKHLMQNSLITMVNDSHSSILILFLKMTYYNFTFR